MLFYNQNLMSNPTNAFGGMSLNLKDTDLAENRFCTGLGTCNYRQCKLGFMPNQLCDCHCVAGV